MKFDLAIIGAGPGGYNAAEKAAEKGLKVVLFDKEYIGGICLNEGCIPTKTLLYSAKLLDQAKSASKYGISIDGNISFDIDKMVKRKNKVVRKLVAGINAELKARGVTIISGEASLQDESSEGIFISCNDESYFASKVILATGSSTFIPPIDGLAKVEYWTSKEALNITTLPEKLAIIGGGVIGIEFASYFASLGVQVSVIEAMEDILMNMDRELVTMLRGELVKKGIKFYLGTKVVEVNENEIIAEKESVREIIPTNKILISVGRKPNIESLKLGNAKVRSERGAIVVDENMQTSNPRIYAIGDVTGKMMLAHTSIRGGEVAVNHLLGVKDSMLYNAVPSVIYTNPELASVGTTEESLNKQNSKFNIHKLPLSYSGRFVAENELENGICKILTDENEVIIGCQILGNPASEIISIATLAIQNKNTLEDFQKYILPHPTVAEILHEVANK